MSSTTNHSRILLLCAATVGVSLVFFTRWRHKKEIRKRGRRKKQGGVNIGGTLISHELLVMNATMTFFNN